MKQWFRGMAAALRRSRPPTPAAPPYFALDELAKDLARGLSRREALRRAGTGLAGAALAALGFHGSAAAAHQPACPHGEVFCNGGCCPPSWSCCSPHCIPPGYQCCPTPQGQVQVCLPGQRCVNGSCVNQCPTGSTPCSGALGSTCCSGHQLCCNGVCCAKDATCCNDGCHPAGFQCGSGCGTGLSLCGSACVDLQTDAKNCGGCNNVCTTGDSCVGGRCTCTAGTVCPAGQVCSSGMCGPCSANAPCPSGLTCCSGACVNIQGNDANNCGACGKTCASGQTCANGACSSGCPSGQIACGGSCVNPMTDSNNCGACGTICRGGKQCSGGQCVCPSGQTDCGGTCVNTQTDASNCGGCNIACPNGESCVSGKCTCTANSQCPAGQVCSNGMCGPCSANAPCASGLTCCSGACVDTKSDRSNCGSCGGQCAAGVICQNGACGCPTGSSIVTQGACARCCPNAQPGQNIAICCDAAGLNGTTCQCTCVDVANDPNNCASCGQLCGPSFACQNNNCVCPAGSTVATQGACARCCPTPQAGQLLALCCDAAGLNGTTCQCTCVDRANDPNNCAQCGNQCPAGKVCQGGQACVNGSCPGDLVSQNGACVCPSGTVNAGFNRCCASGTPTLCGGASGTCVNLQGSDSNNCNACGFKCPGDLVCQSGKCVCSSGTVNAGFNRCCASSTPTLCSGTCVNTQTDKANCGGCGVPCGSSQSCVSGACM